MKSYINIIIAILIYSTLAAQSDTTIVKRNNGIAASFQDTTIKAAPTDTLLKADSVKAVKYKTITGIASFYSLSLHGTKTSTGETYKHHKFTAASNNFKLNSWVRVTNLRNQKSIIVRINDHMHKRMQKKGRVIDLSRSAAQKLDFIRDGITRVRVEEVPAGTTD
jgi:rare lipoprotein A (peptidoglycan hydrolase)